LPAGFTPFHTFDTPGPARETDEREQRFPRELDSGRDLQITKETNILPPKAPSVYRPMPSMIATRFTSGGSLTGHVLSKPEGGLNVKPIIPVLQFQKSETDSAKGDVIPTAESAARMNMFGPLTRMKVDFYPNRLLCKRFNVANPHPHYKAEKVTGKTEKGQRDVLSKETFDDIIKQSSIDNFAGLGRRELSDTVLQGSATNSNRNENEDLQQGLQAQHYVKQPENEDKDDEVLNYTRPDMDIFKAIFGEGDSETDDRPSAQKLKVSRYTFMI
jgi:G patch domain-containing protein 1